MSRIRMQVLGAAAIATAAMLVPTTPTQAAPVTFQTAVLANNPYVYYRLGENQNPMTNVTATDASGNGRDGIYRGFPVGGAAGTGPASDTAVSFPGSTNTGLDYLKAGNTTTIRSFGSQVGRSSYELVFKANAAFTDYESIFGVFNQSDTTVTPNRTNTGAVAIEFNTNATGGANVPGTSRFYVRDENNDALGATISNGTLLDGDYHHLVFTYDDTAAATDYVKAYVDGVSVPVTLVPQGTGGAPTPTTANFLDFTVDPTFGARNLRGVVQQEANVTIDEAALYGNTVLTADDALAHATAAGFVVPEPTSLALLGIGGLGLLRRRRRSA